MVKIFILQAVLCVWYPIFHSVLYYRSISNFKIEMPKKFASENTKAVAARERKKAAKDEANQRKERDLEDAKWRDDDKQILKKQQKKEQEERKRQEQLQRKAEAKVLLEKEMGSIKANKPPPAQKITQAQISAKKVEMAPKKDVEKKLETHLDVPLEENINRLQIDGEEARTVDEAIYVLRGVTEDLDKHPEKRMKAAYMTFEERRLADLKAEHPSLRLSQLKQMIFKEWQRSPENPLNKV
ncbi:coiled-coil domain-containing protein 124-like [Cylas formicarius]|uniref:coiled-coil domain-containing protein 124-like n=1 Tax=Cylas formicarius TaxID=197179 RepID=UPI002958332F|nr:coiled-coil domain-containing protein 124-like [Cylas formicarius]